MELNPTQYAEQQLRKGKTPKQVLKQLKDSDYECDDAYDIVQHARAHRAWKKAAYIAVLAVLIPILAYSVVTSNQPAPQAEPSTESPQPPQNTVQEAITQQDANLCDSLPRQERAACINQVEETQ